MSSMEISNITKETLSRMFAEGKRFDSRDLLDYREIEIYNDISNKAEGSARIKMGKTDVIVGIKLDIGEPYPDSPDQGNLVCSAELLPLASPRFESGPPGFKAIELARLVDRAIRESSMIDLSKLCITKGEKVWTVFIDIYPINDDGNLIDATSIAAVIALMKTKMPILDKEGKIDYEKKSGSLPLLKGTFPISFSFFKLGNSIILDPTREEEEVCEARVSFGISNYNKQCMINSCQKSGTVAFTQEELERMLDILPTKLDNLYEKLKKHL